MRSRIGLALSALGVALTTAASVAASTGSTAAAYAGRTYVIASGVGDRPFRLVGHGVVAHATDGSTITGYAMVIADSGDGSGQAVLLLRNGRFLGWASAFDTLHLSITSSGSAIRVRYGDYTGDDPSCCPSSFRTVSYRWIGGRIVANRTPPLIYGRPGDRLHLRP